MKIQFFKDLLGMQEPEAVAPLCFLFSCLNRAIEEEIDGMADLLPIRLCSFDIGEKNMACCDMIEIPGTDLCKILHWDILDISNGKATKESVQHICRRIPALFENNPYLRKTSRVAIELQPNFNVKMRIISYALDIVFHMFAKQDGRDISVDFIKATRKLEVLSDENREKIKTNYKLRKEMGVQMCVDILDAMDDREHLALLEDKKKRDDYADCFLQGISYVREKRTALSKPKRKRAAAKKKESAPKRTKRAAPKKKSEKRQRTKK